MARQRFIHPDIWEDIRFGRLDPMAQVLFIGLFSLADDEGRIQADPVYLKGAIWRYQDITAAEVREVRDRVIAAMKHVRLYEVDGEEYIVLTSWQKRQRPKYPSPSRLPPPPPDEAAGTKHDSPNVPPTTTEDSSTTSSALPDHSSVGWVGLGRDGLGRDVVPPAVGTPADDRLTAREQSALAVLRSIPRWPEDPAADLRVFSGLRADYPSVDLAKVAGDLAAYYADHPLRPKDNPRLRYRNFVRQEAEHSRRVGAARDRPRNRAIRDVDELGYGTDLPPPIPMAARGVNPHAT